MSKKGQPSKDTKEKPARIKRRVKTSDSKPIELDGLDQPSELIQTARGASAADTAARLTDSRLGPEQRQSLLADVGRIRGNKYLSQVVQLVRESQPATVLQRDGEGESEEAAGEGAVPYGMSTEFGNFMVIPDDFVGPIQSAERDAETWPIRESDYLALMDHLGTIRDGTSNIVVGGDADFQMATFLDLGWLMTAGIGQELISEIQLSSYAVSIVKTTGGNSVSGFSDEAFLLPLSPPSPGPGSGVTVNYNPNRLHIKDGTLDWHHRPPAIGLAHELIHVWEAVNGMFEEEKRDGIDLDEYQAVGLGEFQELRFTENRFRTAFGLPLRPEY